MEERIEGLEEMESLGEAESAEEPENSEGPVIGMEHYRHYVRTGEGGLIVDGFSEAFRKPQAGDICIAEDGGYQFRLFTDGEENPALVTEDGLYQYKWDGEQVVPLTEEEIEAQRPAPVLPSPAELREQAYRTMPCIEWQGQMITVDKANYLWAKYSAEGSETANVLMDLIADAKAKIREQYPDEA